jgi:SAM-dependent methyltransferase
MNLALAHVLSTTGMHCRVQRLDAPSDPEAAPIIDAVYATPMVEHGIRAEAGQLVALDLNADSPTVVYRWPDITVQVTGNGYRLARATAPVDPAALSAEAFPRIHALYERVARARAVDPKRIVREGYDQAAERYLAWVEGERSAVRTRYTQWLLDALPAGAEVLDLGCGAGGPTTQALAARFSLTGVDLSPRSIALAQENVPGARFVQADMAALDLPEASFDGVAAFYSLIHVPRTEQRDLLTRIAGWLRPGGVFVATMGTRGTPGDVDDDFLGTRMYWSTYDSETNRRLIEEAGLQVVHAQEEAEEEHGERVAFLWIVARKPEPTVSQGAPRPGACPPAPSEA